MCNGAESLNKQPPAIVRVRVRRGIVRIPRKQARIKAIVVSTANLEDAENKNGERNTRSPNVIL